MGRMLRNTTIILAVGLTIGIIVELGLQLRGLS